MSLSGFPADLEFRRDNRRNFTTTRVYDRCKDEFDLHEIREARAWHWAMKLEMDKGDVLRAWNWLVKHGYLIEHERGEKGVRRFTLAHSVNPIRRRHRPNRK